VHPENGADLFAAAGKLRGEYVISVAGDVVARDPANDAEQLRELGLGSAVAPGR
jgi:aspartyl-tRNA synthetase